MVTITENKLTIEIEHVCPADLANEIRESLIYNLQNVDYSGTLDLAEIRAANYFMLLLLKEVMEIKDGVGK